MILTGPFFKESLIDCHSSCHSLWPTLFPLILYLLIPTLVLRSNGFVFFRVVGVSFIIAHTTKRQSSIIHS